MSDIIYTPPASSGGGGQNPTTNYIPLNNATSNFVDSNLFNNKDATILTKLSNGDNIGLYVNFNTSNFWLGDYDNLTNGLYFSVDNFQGAINTVLSYNKIGLGLDFINNNYSLGDFVSVSTGIYLNVNPTIKKVNVFDGINSNGLEIDFTNTTYAIGDYAYLNLGTAIVINDNSKSIDLQTEGYVNFKGGNFLSPNSGGSSGDHLIISVNGTQYKIQLLNP
jgi:hypothetical protein